MAAGPIANFLLAIAIFAVTFTFVGMHVTAPRVDELVPDGVAATAGFKAGDVIVSIDGQPIETFDDMQRIVSASADQRADLRGQPGRHRADAQGHAGAARDVRPVRQQDAGRPDRHPAQRHPAGVGIQALSGRSRRFVLGVKETYFIITRTLQYPAAIW